jgi:hypothetical protein
MIPTMGSDIGGLTEFIRSPNDCATASADS